MVNTQRLSGGEQAESDSPSAEREIYTGRKQKTHVTNIAQIGAQHRLISPTMRSIPSEFFVRGCDSCLNGVAVARHDEAAAKNRTTSKEKNVYF